MAVLDLISVFYERFSVKLFVVLEEIVSFVLEMILDSSLSDVGDSGYALTAAKEIHHFTKNQV